MSTVFQLGEGAAFWPALSSDTFNEEHLVEGQISRSAGQEPRVYNPQCILTR